jgi:hypothetical protein
MMMNLNFLIILQELKFSKCKCVNFCYIAIQNYDYISTMFYYYYYYFINCLRSVFALRVFGFSFCNPAPFAIRFWAVKFSCKQISTELNYYFLSKRRLLNILHIDVYLINKISIVWNILWPHTERHDCTNGMEISVQTVQVVLFCLSFVFLVLFLLFESPS